MTKILIVDDEPQLRRVMSANLRERKYEVDLAESGQVALESVSRGHPDAVILDLGLPDIDGLDVIRSVREYSEVPIIVLSVRDSEATKIAALDAGADDYVTKPVGIDELLARLRAQLRRVTPPNELGEITTDDFSINFDSHVSTLRDKSAVKLTPTEWSVIEVLIRNTGKLVTSKHLLQMVWGGNYGKEANYLRVYMAQIRRKLEPNPSQPRYFLTESGMGYRFQMPLAALDETHE